MESKLCSGNIPGRYCEHTLSFVLKNDSFYLLQNDCRDACIPSCDSFCLCRRLGVLLAPLGHESADDTVVCAAEYRASAMMNSVLAK